jgi:UDP-glucose 4-epimerase
MNIGTAVEVTVNDLYRRLAGLAGVSRAPERAPRREGDWRRGALDATRAAERLGWKPVTSLDAGLAQTMAYFKTEQAGNA